MSLKSRFSFRRSIVSAASLVGLAVLLRGSMFAAVPPAEKLLPPDTLLVITTPDWAKLRDLAKKSPQAQFWDDVAMKPFRDKFMTKLTEEVIKPLERDLGVKFDDYSTLLQGQLTIAVTQEAWQGKAKDDGVPAVLLLLDTKDKSDLLKKNLTELRKKWSDAGKPIRTEKIRDVEFSVVPLTTNDIPSSLRQMFPQPQEIEELGKDEKKPSTEELIIGQRDSLLIIGTSVPAVEKVLVRLAGNSAPTLAEQSEFEACRSAGFRDAPFFVWFNAKTAIEVATKAVIAAQNPDAPSPFPMPDINKIINASGLGDLKSAAFSFRDTGDGRIGEFFLSAPEAGRAGLLKLLALEAKETTPPTFVPADVVKFARFRLDGQKAIATIEKMVSDISPEALSTWNFVLNNGNEAARIDDPDYDIRKNIFGNLGDDIITYEKAPKGKSLAELGSAPSLFLLGSPNAEKLAASLKGLFVIISPQGGSPKTREFLGRKIFSFKIPTMVAGGTAAARSLSYVASGGYVAFSMDDGILEEYLRSSESQVKPLRETPGFADAAAKVGGQGNGWLAYENEAETMKSMMEALARSVSSTNKNEFAEVLASTIPFAPPEKKIKEWVDFSLLPSYDKVAKYFGFGVSGGSTTVSGISFKYYLPNPPELLKK